MSDASTYSVISTGKIHADFGLADVQESFVKLFKTTPEKASKYVGVKKILKKDLEHGKAQVLKSRLESIGMVIALKEHKPISAEPMDLTIEEKAPEKADTTMTCPKCDLQQEKAEQCSSCGVFMEKLLGSGASDTIIGPSTIIGQSTAITEPQADGTAEETPVAVMTVQEADSLKMGGIAAAAIAAVLGALVWKYVAVIFGYEHGLLPGELVL